MPYPEWIDTTEAKIIDRIIASALAAGAEIDVRDAYGDSDEPIDPMTDPDLIRAEVGATGETLFDFHEPGAPRSFGWVLLIHGNGWDVMSDYTDNDRTKAILAPVEKFCDGGAEALLAEVGDAFRAAQTRATAGAYMLELMAAENEDSINDEKFRDGMSEIMDWLTGPEKVWVVEGHHPTIPGSILQPFACASAAEARAAELKTVIASDVEGGDAPTDPEDFVFVHEMEVKQ